MTDQMEIDSPPSKKKLTSSNNTINTNPNPNNSSNNLNPNNLYTLSNEAISLIISPLYKTECTNKTFKNLLISLDNFSLVGGNKEIIFQELFSVIQSNSSHGKEGREGRDSREVAREGSLLLEELISDLWSLKKVISTDNTLETQKFILEKFSPSESSQAKFLRIVKAIDYLFSTISSKSKEKSDGGKKEVVKVGSDNKTSGDSKASSSGNVSNSVSTPNKQSTYSNPNSIISIDSIVKIFNQPLIHECWLILNDLLVLISSTSINNDVTSPVSDNDNPTSINELGKFQFVANSLLPLIECLMIVCKYRIFQQKSKVIKTDNEFSSPPSLHKALLKHQQTNSETEDSLFMQFSEKHKKLLNNLVRLNPKLLKGSFSLLIHNPKVLEFDNKRSYFSQQLHRKSSSQHKSIIYINIRRDYIFQDSYYQLQNKSGTELKYGKLSVRFYDEEAADYGGVSREWFQLLTKEMFNPNYALFLPSAEKNGITYAPNPTSWVNPSHLLYFKFVGRVIGKAIYDSRLLDCYFVRSVYKYILGKNVDLSDMESIDVEYYKSLKWICDNFIDDAGLDLNFSLEIDEFGVLKVVDLIENGRNVLVTDKNKHEYVKLVVENRLFGGVKDQITAFLDGFFEIIPAELIKIFNEKELELLISGIPDIDIDDWRNNTDYRGYTSSSPQIQWFWRCVRSFDTEERAKLLQFATGTSKVPLEGFSQLKGSGGVSKFCIQKDFGGTERLVSAHTCFNQIDLPVYGSYEVLRERLLKSVSEGHVGFGFE